MNNTIPSFEVDDAESLANGHIRRRMDGLVCGQGNLAMGADVVPARHHSRLESHSLPVAGAQTGGKHGRVYVLPLYALLQRDGGTVRSL